MIKVNLYITPKDEMEQVVQMRFASYDDALEFLKWFRGNFVGLNMIVINLDEVNNEELGKIRT